MRDKLAGSRAISWSWADYSVLAKQINISPSDQVYLYSKP